MKVQSVPIDSIHADPANVRRHPEKNVEAIKASLVRFGQVKPIVVDGKGIVRAGNGTPDAARALGWTEINIVQTELQGSEATAYGIADNRTSELAEWDDTGLAEVLRSLQSEDFDLGAIGFTSDEVDELVEGLGDAALVEGGSEESPPRPSLADRFLIPPFSVLDARQGYWQERKRAWIALGIQSELGRGANHLGFSEATNEYRTNHGEYAKKLITGGASPGGSPRPAMKLVDGKTVRGDGAGRPL